MPSPVILNAKRTVINGCVSLMNRLTYGTLGYSASAFQAISEKNIVSNPFPVPYLLEHFMVLSEVREKRRCDGSDFIVHAS